MAWSYHYCLLLSVLVVSLCCKPVSSNWSQWLQWSAEPCSVTCGTGEKVMTRSRFCQNAENNCPGPRVDKHTAVCNAGVTCAELSCYECNIFANGKLVPCTEARVETGCRACMKSFTLIRVHDRIGETNDMSVESRLCLRDSHYKKVSEEGCEYKKANGGFSALCFCMSDKCNSGMRQGSSLGLIVLIGVSWTFLYRH
ncbi:uncharacterized protein LOC124288638 [Haliotis rubra]|uniref:uncharacterized protein LOC124288638 n=1 Tax=Haliotis rubra TaxID=36100 RepID=UPI001EE5B92E|nr:uncharacterized protein LOC124288638 [Haliotis rubra]